jgi:fructose/tagatose bisphosphate aldolase
MYLECNEYVKNHFLKDAFVSGFFIGIGNFCSFATYSAVFYAAKKMNTHIIIHVFQIMI